MKNHSVCMILLVSVAAALAGAETWPGVKVTYARGTDFTQPVLTTYEPELRHDCWVPSPRLKKYHLEPYSVRYEAMLRIDSAGQYQFRPDDARSFRLALFIDDTKVAWTTCKIDRQRRDKKSTVEVPISAPVTLQPGTVAIRFELVNKSGRVTMRDPCDLLWRGPDFEERPLSPARLSIEPWPDMKRRPIIRYAMVGHSNVEGRTRSRRVEAKRAWSYDANKRMWKPLHSAYNNHTSGLVAALSEKYPDHYFGGIMLGKGGSNLCDQWREDQVLSIRARRVVKNTAWQGPLMAMGSHFDWDEVKRDEFTQNFESCSRQMIALFRRELDQSDLPWLLTTITPFFKTGWGGSAAGRYAIIRQANDTTAANVPGVYLVNTDDFDKTISPDMHYKTRGFELWTERAIAQLEGAGAIRAAIARLDETPTPYPQVEELQPRWPISRSPTEPVLIVYGTITRISKPRSPKDLGPYPDALMAIEYAVNRHMTHGAPYQPQRVLALVPSVRNRSPTAAVDFKVGDKHGLVLASWDAQPSAITQMPVDDDIQELDLPPFYTLAITNDKVMQRPGKLRLMYGSKRATWLVEAKRADTVQE